MSTTSQSMSEPADDVCVHAQGCASCRYCKRAAEQFRSVWVVVGRNLKGNGLLYLTNDGDLLPMAGDAEHMRQEWAERIALRPDLQQAKKVSRLYAVHVDDLGALRERWGVHP